MTDNFEYNSKRINYQGKQIQTYTFGDGENIIFALPSYPHSGLYYLFFTKFYTENNYKFITFDLPGWAGWSENVFLDDQTQPTIPKFLDIAEAVLAEYGVKEFSLLGYSFGSALAFMLAAREPARIKKLVLVSPLIFGQYTYGTNQRAQLVIAKRVNAYKILKSLFVYKTKQILPYLEQYIKPELLSLYTSMFAQADGRVLLRSIWELFNINNDDLLPQIRRIKDIMVVSSQDEDRLFRYQAQHLRHKLDSEKTLIIHGSHDDFIINPKSSTVSAVMDFLTH